LLRRRRRRWSIIVFVVVVILPSVAPEETARFGVMELPIFSADPTEFMPATSIAASHMVATIVLFNWCLAFRTRSCIGLHPEALSNVVEIHVIAVATITFLWLVEFTDLFGNLIIPFFKKLALDWPMHLLRTARKTESVSSLRLDSVSCHGIIRIAKALVRDRTRVVFFLVVDDIVVACTNSTRQINEGSIKLRRTNERREESPNNSFTSRMGAEANILCCSNKVFVGSHKKRLINVAAGGQLFNFN
jgi:hypothetical protein